jgi:adenine-specific DNA-methyltransferase
MPSLNWIGKEAVVNHDKEVPFKLLEKIPNASVGKESKNLIIHGDNLEALKALMPFYKGRVRCIYIDPPYNTGNEGWVYSDAVNSSKIREWLGKVVGPEAQDLTRHDKWLCMMYPRLKLLRDLLAENGTIFISIDDNEFSSLRFIMNEVFGEYNFVANFVWKSKGSGAYDTKAIKTEHEYILCFAKQIERVTFAQIPFDTTQDLQYTHSDSRLSLAGKYKRQAMAMGTLTYSESLDYPLTNPDGKIAYPGGVKGKPFIWRWNKLKLEKAIKDGFAEWVKTKNGWSLYSKQYERLDSEGKAISRTVQQTTIITNLLSRNGTQEIQDILGSKLFDYPKPSGLIKEFIRLVSQKNDIILDSFAGSGTTGQAVLDLNKEDGGKRNFILVEMENNVAKKVTAERVRRVIKKHNYKDGFEYCELAKPLFNELGQINQTCLYMELAAYIYFTETKTNIDKKVVKPSFIGKSQDISYYLIYAGMNKNDLTRNALSRLKVSGRAVIYADRCLVDEDALKEKMITFKQIPYEIRVY